ARNGVWMGWGGGSSEVGERDRALLSPGAAAISHYPGGHAEGFPDTFKQLYLDVYNWIISGRASGRPPAFPSFADGDLEVRLCEAIARSAALERPVTVDEPAPMESDRSRGSEQPGEVHP